MLLWRVKCKTLCVYRNPARRGRLQPRSQRQHQQRLPEKQNQAAATKSTATAKEPAERRRCEWQLRSQRRPPKGGRHKAQCNVKAGRGKQRPYQIKSGVKSSLLLFLVDVFGLFVEVGGVVFQEALLQFLFGDARGFARPGVIHHGAAADQQLASAARDDYDVGKLAIWCILEMSHVKISLQKTSGFREFVLHSAPPGNASPERWPALPCPRAPDHR